VVLLGLISRKILGETEENHRKAQSGQPESGLSFHPFASSIHSGSILRSVEKVYQDVLTYHNIGTTFEINRLIGHENSYVTELRNPLNVRRRLKRQWPSDLKGRREQEE
jgi:hypothetical protein